MSAEKSEATTYAAAAGVGSAFSHGKEAFAPTTEDQRDMYRMGKTQRFKVKYTNSTQGTCDMY